MKRIQILGILKNLVAVTIAFKLFLSYVVWLGNAISRFDRLFLNNKRIFSKFGKVILFCLIGSKSQVQSTFLREGKLPSLIVSSLPLTQTKLFHSLQFH